MRDIKELTENSDKIRREIESTFSDQDKYEEIPEEERTELIKDYLFVMAYQALGDVGVEKSKQVYDEIKSGKFEKNGKQIETGNEKFAEDFARFSDGKLLLRTLKRKPVHRVMFGTSFGVGTNTALRDRMLKESNAGNLEESFINAEKKEREKAKPINPDEAARDIENKKREQERERERQKKAEEERKREQEQAAKRKEQSRQRKQKNADIREGAKKSGSNLISEFETREAARKPLSQEYAKEVAGNLYEKIKKVDFNMLGKGSPQFKEMKESLKNLKDYSNKPGFDPATYYDMQRTAMDKVAAYLDKKKSDFDLGKSNRNDPSKQKREQPRIQAATEIFGELESSFAAGRNAVIENERDRAKATLTATLGAEASMRTQGRLNDNELKKSVIASAAILVAMNDGDYALNKTPKVGDSLKDYVSNMRKSVSALETGSSRKDINKALNNRNVSRIVEDVEKTNAIEFNVQYSAENIENCAKKYVPDDMKIDKGLDKNIPKTSKKMEDYKKNLYSDETKKKLGMPIDKPKTEKKVAQGKVM